MGNWNQSSFGVMPGGDVGGDGQATEAWSVRYHNTKEPTEGLHSMITIYFYGEGQSDDGVDYTGPYGMTMQIEYMICRDINEPGGTEEWRDYNHLDLSGYQLATVEAAETVAKRLAYALKLDAIEWDGTSKREYDSTGWLITS